MPVVPTTIVVLVAGAVMLARRVDIRLVLLLAAAALFGLRATQPEVAGRRFDAFAQFFGEFARGMTSPQWVLPICSAMGFAYVCKMTGCDAHLVHLLLRPLRHVRWALVPGGIAVAFFVNSAIVSQTSTVSVVGPVLVPLLLAAGYTRVTTGALLLLGGSMGGELLNPAAVEVTAINKVTGESNLDIITHLLPYNLLACGVALVVFWAMSFWYEARATRDRASSRDGSLDAEPRAGTVEKETIDDVTPEPGSIAAMMTRTTTDVAIDRVNVFKALVPLVPIFLLVVVKRLLEKHGALPPTFITDKQTNPYGEQAAIGAAMIIGAVCAAATAPRQSPKVPAAFFEGAGFVYAHVISIIAAATMFAESVRANGLIERMTAHLQDAPATVATASIVIPWIFACVTGTAVGTAPLVIQIILPIAMGLDAGGRGVRTAAGVATGLRVGSVNAIAAQFGRTSSPVAPVTIMCATLARVRPLDLVKRVTPPLIAGGIALLIAALLFR